MKLILIYICCLTILIFCSTTFAYDNRPIIVLREDNTRATCRNIFPEFGNMSFLDYGKQLKIPVTWGVITNQTTSGANGTLSWAELIDYVTNAGGELASHSASHIWSDISVLPFLPEEINIANILLLEDGDTVVASGYVSAIFDDFYYIQSLNPIRGIMVIGPTGSLINGANVIVEGIMDTNDAGERFIQVQNPLD